MSYALNSRELNSEIRIAKPSTDSFLESGDLVVIFGVGFEKLRCECSVDRAALGGGGDRDDVHGVEVGEWVEEGSEEHGWRCMNAF